MTTNTASIATSYLNNNNNIQSDQFYTNNTNQFFNTSSNNISNRSTTNFQNNQTNNNPNQEDNQIKSTLSSNYNTGKTIKKKIKVVFILKEFCDLSEF